MSEFIQQIGIDGRLLLSQAVNFILLIIVLRLFAYKPIVRILNERRTRIAEGLTKAEEADRRLGQANEMAKEKMKEAEGRALTTIREGEARAKEREAELLQETHKKEAAMMKQAELAALAKKEEAEREIAKEAAAVVKAAIAKTVEMDPDKIDEALIKKALTEVKMINS